MARSDHDHGKDGAPDMKAEGGDYDVVHARLLRNYPELVAELGGDATALRRAAGLATRGAAVTYRDFVNLLQISAEELACSDFGMRLAVRQNGAGLFGPLGQAMRHSRNFGEALRYVSDHAYAHSLAARVWLQPWQAEDGEARVFSGHDILVEGAARREQALEQILLAGHLAAMQITGGKARVRAVHFRHEPVSAMRTYRRFFGCDVHFGQPADGVVFSAEDLAAPVIAADEGALNRMTAYIDSHFTRRQPPLHAQVRAVMVRLLPTGNCSNTQVASSLCLHLRTLHRRLQDEGTSFQALKDEVRRDLLSYYLRDTDLELFRISERLGFAEQSVMSRACRRWFGMAPSTLRRDARRAA